MLHAARLEARSLTGSRPGLRTAALGLAAAAVQLAVTVPLLGRYGWDRDELYFLSAARHPALGYVDFPPLSAWSAWAIDRVAPDSLVALRVTSMLLGAATVVLVALTARELGGGARAQLGGALAWASTPYILGSASIYHPTWFDALAWVAFTYLAARLLRRGETRLWPALGAVAGLGLEAKYTIVFLLGAFGIALAAGGHRRLLATRGPWIGVAVALALLSPNLVWQALHGWPSLHFFASQDAKTAADTPPAAYLAEQALFLGGAFAIAAIGVRRLWREPALRPLGILPVLVTLIFLFERGRGYYPLPADAVAVAAGAVALERRLRWRLRLPALLAVLQVATLVLAGPIVVPFHTAGAMVRSGVWKNSFFKDEIGWPQFAAQVEGAWQGLPATTRDRAIVIANNYGEASALAYYRPRLPVISGHLSWQYWRPRSLPQTAALVVGYDRGTLAALCGRWTVVARVRMPFRLANQEQGEPIASCELRKPLELLWRRYLARTAL